MTDGKILQMLLDEKKITIKELASQTSIPEQTLYSMRKRNSNKTGNNIKAAISKALNVPISIWNMTSEEYALRQMGYVSNPKKINSKNLKALLKIKNMPIEAIKYSLDCLGYNNEYSIEDINNIINNELPINDTLAYDIEYIVLNDYLLSKDELDMLKIIRNLRKESRDYLEMTIQKLVKVDKYEDILLAEFAESLKKN